MTEQTIKLVGLVDIPEADQMQWGKYQAISKRVIEQLVPGKAMRIDFEDAKTLEHFRRGVGMTATRTFGSGKIKTAKIGLQLYVWLREIEETPRMTVVGKDVIIRDVFTKAN